MKLTCQRFAAIAVCLSLLSGLAANRLNLTLQLTTADFLPVSTMLHAAAQVWGLNETSIQVLSATARHAGTKVQAGARRLLESQDTDSNIQLDFAAMQRDDPKLLTLKDFVMSSNQAPESPSDVLSLLQAFAEFQQGSAAESSYDNSMERTFDSPSARYALAAMKPSPKPQSEQTTSTAQAAATPVQTTSSSASDIHPHLLFLKTGGGSTVAQPKHQLTPQQLQVLADGTGTLEGLAVGEYSPLTGYVKPANSQQSVQQGASLQGATLQQQEPLGSATVVLGTEDSTQQLASLFTPRNDLTLGKAIQALSQRSEHRDASQGLFSSASSQQQVQAGKASVHPTAKSLQGVYATQPNANRAGFSALSSAAAGRHGALMNPNTLSWLDEPILPDAEPAAKDDQKPVIQGPLEPYREREGFYGQLTAAKGSSLAAARQPADARRPTLSRTVLLTLVLSIATDSKEALQQVVGDSILNRQLQQQIGREGFSVNQLDVSFSRQGVFSSESGAFSVDISEMTEGKRSEHMNVSVRTVVRHPAEADASMTQQGNTEAMQQADKSMMPAYNITAADHSWPLELFICIAGFILALAVLIVGVCKYNTSRAGRQAAECFAAESIDGLWVCGQNPLRQPLIARHPAAEGIC